MSYRVHATMDWAQPHCLKPSGYGPPAHPELQQLTTSNHAMLPIGELGDRDIHARDPLPRANRLFGTYTVLNVRFAGHCPIVAASV
jgi:hypothetical protein